MMLVVMWMMVIFYGYGNDDLVMLVAAYCGGNVCGDNDDHALRLAEQQDEL